MVFDLWQASPACMQFNATIFFGKVFLCLVLLWNENFPRKLFPSRLSRSNWFFRCERKPTKIQDDFGRKKEKGRKKKEERRGSKRKKIMEKRKEKRERKRGRRGCENFCESDPEKDEEPEWCRFDVANHAWLPPPYRSLGIFTASKPPDQPILSTTETPIRKFWGLKIVKSMAGHFCSCRAKVKHPITSSSFNRPCSCLSLGTAVTSRLTFS